MDSLSNHFLIAMPSLQDSHFHRAVVLLGEHNEGGAMGVVINHPTELPFSKILDHFDITTDDASLSGQKVLRGGPLRKDHGFILHQPQGAWKGMVPIADDLGLTTSRDILQAMVEEEGSAPRPEQALVILGCAGWLPGQLEEEIRDNVWLSVPADPYILFECPYHDRWRQAAGLIGVDVERLSSEAGHA